VSLFNNLLVVRLEKFNKEFDPYKYRSCMCVSGSVLLDSAKYAAAPSPRRPSAASVQVPAQHDLRNRKSATLLQAASAVSTWASYSMQTTSYSWPRVFPRFIPTGAPRAQASLVWSPAVSIHWDAWWVWVCLPRCACACAAGIGLFAVRLILALAAGVLETCLVEQLLRGLVSRVKCSLGQA